MIISPTIIVLGAWENDLQKAFLVGVSLFAFGFTLKNPLDYIDEKKGNKYLKGKMAILIWGTLAFLIMAVIPLGNFVRDVNTDLLTFISLGLMISIIRIKKGGKSNLIIKKYIISLV
ncbi:hypothetical protein QUH71_02295 [Priestia aryabhattai]|uniref:hypothetical protein n=1 Tax=Priestia aryabhattai TaxID=412384 RepID=UPI0025A44238|nr:hypothetical protein [Priestia aryabhattai]WJN45334.1 hypothetical protein QUH71_02295 [Priestia aryabhattai]